MDDNANLPLAFGSNFLRDHAGAITADPRVAILELLANAYDAGATKVEISWPSGAAGELKIIDNGIGMTREEFSRRWGTLSYSRIQEQGAAVIFPPGVKKHSRTAFGRNGKGRYSPFCFADSYTVTTTKNGKRIIAEVRLTDGGSEPFHSDIESEVDGLGHGTIITAQAHRRILPPETIAELIGSKFSVDPSFSVTLNGRPVSLQTLKDLHTAPLDVEGVGQITIHRIDAAMQDRTIKLRGITWWVNGRMVGEPSWDGLDGEGQYLDGRTAEAKRYSFVIEANVLLEEVKADWTGFFVTKRFNLVRDQVHQFVIKTLGELMSESRKSRKIEALARSRTILQDLPAVAKAAVGKFVDEVQERCPSLSPKDLAKTVEIFSKLEQSKTGYELLTQLAGCSPDDLDTWNRLMGSWDAGTAEIVLNELDKRLTLIKRLNERVGKSTSDELHVLQPLFERGLWIFGPEYEGIEFRSNRGMAEIVKNFFGLPEADVSRRRPDFVALADSSVGIYSADAYGDDGEVHGVSKVLIVELKRGGFTLAQKELDQARDYALELREQGCVQSSTLIECWVLGSICPPSLQFNRIGDFLKVIPATYSTVLARAQARLFHLQQQIDRSLQERLVDPEIEEVLASSEADDLLFGLDNEIAIEAEVHSVVVAEVAIEKSGLNTAPPDGPVIQ
jgi:histidine kinase/DNA gyrase B/HSP90-like ATPase